MRPHIIRTHVVVFLFSVFLTYFSSCHARPQCVDSEREALLQFKHGIRDRCGFLDSWGGSQDCCQWHGIRCNNHTGYVTGLDLPASDYDHRCLKGTLGASLVELKHLKYLDLSFNYFTGSIPKFIGNLSRLTSLDLSINRNLSVKSLSWLTQLRLLRNLNLDGIDMSLATNWLSIVNNLPFLESLSLGDCRLSLKLPSSLSYINSSTSLREISLQYNNLNDTSIFEWLFNLTGLDTTLVSLYLSGNNQMFGSNYLEPITQRVMKFLGNLCSLRSLLLSETNLSYDFSDIVDALSACPHKSLEELYLDRNQIWGSIPDSIDTFSSLTDLSLENNQLKGTVTTSLLSNLSKLQFLGLADNTELVINISDDWNPPFQLEYLHLRSCKIGPRFPKWLKTQTKLWDLDISNTSISDTISDSVSKSLFWSGLTYVNMSRNRIFGVFPNQPANVFFTLSTHIDLSYNNLEGAIPLFLRNVSYLRLNNNKLSEGLGSFLCPNTKMQLSYLDLSNNLFSTELPDCWRFFDQLSVLNLENNNLWGNLPTSIGLLDKLKSLHLSKNNLSGELPMSLVNCTSLVNLDLAYNSLTGYIPPALGHNFKNLSLLILRSNQFFGALPSSLCYLTKLQILDVARNHISGTIPKCVYNLKGMANPNEHLYNLLDSTGDYTGADETYDNEQIMWKRQERIFEGNRSLGTLVDLSDNKLEGQIPDEISSLVGIISLNLSGNSLSGAIPSKIGQMVSLESLDLSHNNLSGQIPTSLAQINNLGTLDVSYNHLSGKIPVGPQLQTFDNTSYKGNPGLCGLPLPECRIPQNEENNIQQDEHGIADDDIYPGLYISVVLGFIVGFWGVCGTLIIKRSWRIAFFRFYDDMKDKVHVMLVVHTPRAWRRS